MLFVFLCYLLFGAIAGLVAGLFGVGGGVILVPAFIYLFTLQGMDVMYLTHVAVGSSLAVICVTSVSSVMAHHKNGFVHWPLVKTFVPGLLIGAALGVVAAHYISGVNLQLIIGSFLCLVSLQMGFALMPERHRDLPSAVAIVPVAGVIGLVSAMFGIGGGSLTVPYLSVVGVKMQRAVATSAACGVPIAFASVLSNAWVGFGRTAELSYSLGYIYWPAVLGVALMSAPFAKVGAQLAQKLPAAKLKRLFAAFLAMIGSLMIFKSQGML